MKKYLKLSLITIFIFLIDIVGVHAEENIELIKVELQERSEYVIVNEDVSLDGNKIKTNVNFYDEGDYVVYKLTVKNNDNQDYKIEEITDNNENEYLDFEYIYEGLLEGNSEKEVLLKITYKSRLPYDSVLTPENIVSLTSEVAISVKLSEEVINPSTFDKAHLYLVLEIVGVVTLLVIFIKLKKKNAILLLLLAILLVPKSAKAKIELELNFSLENTIEAKVNFLKSHFLSSISGEYTKIEFVKKGNLPEGAIDVSQNSDETIMAWIEDGTLYIGSRYMIFFPEDSSSLLSKNNLTEIEFNNRIDTTFVKNMTSMFFGNENLSELDLSNFRTGNVTNINYMFEYNKSINSLDLSSFDLSNLTNTEYFLYGTSSLKEIFTPKKLPEDENIKIIFYAVYTDDGNNYYRELDNSLINKKISLIGAILDYGMNFNSKIKSIANNRQYSYMDLDHAINGIVKNDTIPEEYLTNNNVVSDYSSSVKIYAWYDQGIIKLYSDAEILFLNENSNYTFSNLKGLLSFDASIFQATFANTAYYMFYETGTGNNFVLSNIGLWDTSKIADFSSMFEEFATGVNNLEMDLTGLDLSSAINVNKMFYNCSRNTQTVHFKFTDVNLENATSADLLFAGFGMNGNSLEINIDNWSLKKIDNLNLLFYELGKSRASVVFNASNWDVQGATKANYTFQYLGSSSGNVEVNLSNWNFPNLTSGNYVLSNMGNQSGIVNINASNWNLSKLNTFSAFAQQIGDNSGVLNVNLKNWDLSGLTNMSYFLGYNYGGQNSIIFDLTGWNVSNARSMNNLFYYYGNKTTNLVSIKGLETWDTSNVTDMSFMFYTIGSSAKKIELDVSNFDVSNVTNFTSMFKYSGNKAEEFSIGDLSNWEIRSATSLDGMLGYVGMNATGVLDIGTLNIYVPIISSAFSYAKCLKVVINLHNPVTSYDYLFDNAAMNDCSEIIVNYTSDVTNIDDLIATKSLNSNIIKGELIEG